MPAYLQNIMNGAVEEFSAWGEAFDLQIVRNRGDEHWSLFTSRPAEIEPQSTAPFIIKGTEGPGIGTYERQAHCEREIGRQQMAALGTTLGRIEGADDITQFLQAAE